MSRDYPNVPVTWSQKDMGSWIRKVALAINAILAGRSNATGTLTLTANAGTTTLTDARIQPMTCINWMPTTAHASAEIGAGTIYAGTVTAGSAIITHANNAQTNRIFTYSLLG